MTASEAAQATQTPGPTVKATAVAAPNNDKATKNHPLAHRLAGRTFAEPGSSEPLALQNIGLRPKARDQQ